MMEPHAPIFINQEETCERIVDSYTKRWGGGSPEEIEKSGAVVPTAADLSSTVSLAFWASLIDYEGSPTNFRILFSNEISTFIFVEFEKTHPMTLASLRSLSSAIDPDEHALAARYENGVLKLWGVCASRGMRIGISTLDRGVVKIHQDHSVRAIFERGRSILRLENHENADGYAQLFASLKLPFVEQRLRGEIIHKIATQMSRHGKGGSIVIVPNREFSMGAAFFADPTIQPKKPVDDLKIAMQEWLLARESKVNEEGLQIPQGIFRLNGNMSKFEAIVYRMNLYAKSFGQLTSTDGALVITEDMELLAVGAKIYAAEIDFPVLTLKASEPVEKGECRVADLGGTRHQSAARLVASHPACSVITASSDGPITLFTWVQDVQKVLAVQRLDWQI